MNIFILSTGRCGTSTFIKACQHINNYTAAHESRVTLIGSERLAYPANHIEADNRLSWLLGRLDRAFGDNAFYVYLQRDPAATAASFVKRADFGIMKAYREGILMEGRQEQSAQAQALDYIETIDTNIQCFLKNKSRLMKFRLEHAKDDFCNFWAAIGAEGDRQQALLEWDVSYNASTD